MLAIRQTFVSLGEPSYRNLWIGSLLQIGGMQMFMVAGGYYIYEITESASMLGFITAAAAVPAIMFSLFGGVIADKMEKKRIIQAGQAVSLLVALFIGIFIAIDSITWMHFLVVSLIQGAVMPLIMPARQAIVPQLVGEERLMNAVALNAMVLSLTTMVSPGLAGILIATVGIDTVYFIIAGLSGGAVLFTGLLPKIETPPSASTNMITDIKNGLEYVYSIRVILMLILLSFGTMMFALPLRFILPIFAKDIFLVGPEGLGTMMSMMGVGALGGALFVASVKKLNRRGTVLIGTGIFSGIVLLGFSLMSHIQPIYSLSLIFMVLMGIIQSGRMALGSSLIMQYTDQEFRGRVMSFITLTHGAMPAAVVPVTIMVDNIGAPPTTAIMAILLIALTLTVYVGSSTLRKLD